MPAVPFAHPAACRLVQPAPEFHGATVHADRRHVARGRVARAVHADDKQGRQGAPCELRNQGLACRGQAEAHCSMSCTLHACICEPAHDSAHTRSTSSSTAHALMPRPCCIAMSASSTQRQVLEPLWRGWRQLLQQPTEQASCLWGVVRVANHANDEVAPVKAGASSGFISVSITCMLLASHLLPRPAGRTCRGWLASRSRRRHHTARHLHGRHSKTTEHRRMNHAS